MVEGQHIVRSRDGRVSARPQRTGLSHSHIRTLLNLRELGSVELWQGGHLLCLRRAGSSVRSALRTKRGEVKGFSSASRRRMLRLVNCLRLDELPWFVTLTFPDCVPTPDNCAAAWHRFCMRFRRQFPSGAFVWRRELQVRKSGSMVGIAVPHYHLLVFGVPPKFTTVDSRGAWVTVRKGCVSVVSRSNCEVETDRVSDRLREWVARTWYEAVGCGQWSHYQAGTNVESLQKIGGVKYYVSKYAAKLSACVAGPYDVGRVWGVCGRCNLPFAERHICSLPDAVMVRLLRFARSYVRSVGGFNRRRWNWRCANIFLNNSGPWRRLLDILLGDAGAFVPF